MEVLVSNSFCFVLFVFVLAAFLYCDWFAFVSDKERPRDQTDPDLHTVMMLQLKLQCLHDSDEPRGARRCGFNKDMADKHSTRDQGREESRAVNAMVTVNYPNRCVSIE